MPVPLHVERANPARRRHRFLANRILSLAICQQCCVLIEQLQLEMVELIALHDADGAGNELHYLVLIRYSAEADLNVIVGQKILKKFAVAFLPGFP